MGMWTEADVLRIQQYQQGQRSMPTPVPPEFRLAADLLPRLHKLAAVHGWRGMDTYNALGPDHGLHVILVRDVIIFADIKDDSGTRTASQQRWAEALDRTGKAETYSWTPADWPAIQARLTQPPRWKEATTEPAA